MMRILLPILLCGVALGQNQPGKFAFEAASIQSGDPGTVPGSGSVKLDDSRFSMRNLNLMVALQIAYGLPPQQISGPDWLTDQRFTIEAKLPPGALKEQAPEMLQTLLAERFRLTAHHEERVLPAYAMTVAKDGPKFRESTSEDTGDGGCKGGFRKVCDHVTMETLAAMFTRFTRINAIGALDRPVVDMTGLTDRYDFVLEQGLVGGRGAQATPDAEIVTVFQALKVLGLRLEPDKHPYDYVVIDHVERVPTEN